MTALNYGPFLRGDTMARIKKGPTTEITPSDISEIIGTLTNSYGPFPDEPRLDPAHELTFTILSQHTSDTNSERAFQGLMNRFGDLMSVAQADISDIERSEEHTSELQSLVNLVCRLLLEKKNQP